MTVRAGADNDLVDFHLANLVDCAGVFGKMGECNGGFYGGKVDFVGRVVLCVRISLIHGKFLIRALLNVINSLFVNLKDSVLRACLNSHIRYGKAVENSERSNSLSNEFHRFVKCAVNAYHSYDMKNYVLAGNVFIKLSLEDELYS